MTYLKSGKVIKSLLLSNNDIRQKCQSNIVPLLDDEALSKMPMPFVSYQRTSITTDTNKDFVDLQIYYSIYVMSRNYEQSLDIAEQICETLVDYSGEVDNITVEDITLESGSESWSDGVFIQELSIRMDIEK